MALPRAYIRSLTSPETSSQQWRSTLGSCALCDLAPRFPRLVNVDGFAMDATKVNSFIALVTPPQGESLSKYLEDALFALKVGSGANLARELGVAPPTLASWKLRGSVPESHAVWFKETFPLRVFERWEREGVPVGGDLPLMCAIEFLRRTDCNPLKVANDKNYATAHLFAGLVAMAGFIMRRPPGLLQSSDETVVAFVADRLKECIEQLLPGLRRMTGVLG